VANEFFSSIHRGVEDVAREHGVAVVAASLDRNPERERELVGAFAARRVDGLIIAPTAPDQGYLATELRSGWPMVVFDRQAHGITLDTVLTDNRIASANAVAHLIRHGHTRIAFIGSSEHLTTEQLRYAGYTDAIESAGLVVDSRRVVHGIADADEAAQITGELIEMPGAPTAIFSGQNLITMGCVRALRARQRQHAVALVGFDDFAMADLLEPAITVVAQDARAMGRKAAELVFNRIDAASAPVDTYVVPARLIARGSGEIRA
jgi:LacI family transcriptional regulator